MTFTFSQLPIGTPEQTSPWNNLLANSLKNYQHILSAKYAPQSKEADIFAKEIAPLAQLAANPNFKGFNPETQAQISKRVSDYLSKAHEGAQGEGQNGNFQETTSPGYDEKKLFSNLTKGAETVLGKGGTSKVVRSNIAGIAEKSGLPEWISNALGGNETAGIDAQFKNDIKAFEHWLIMNGYSPQEAAQIAPPRRGENAQQYIENRKAYFPRINNSQQNNIPAENQAMNPMQEQEYNEEENTPTNIEEKISNDEQAKADAEATAKAYSTPKRRVTAKEVLQAQALGIKTAKDFKNFLAGK